MWPVARSVGFKRRRIWQPTVRRHTAGTETGTGICTGAGSGGWWQAGGRRSKLLQQCSLSSDEPWIVPPVACESWARGARKAKRIEYRHAIRVGGACDALCECGAARSGDAGRVAELERWVSSSFSAITALHPLNATSEACCWLRSRPLGVLTPEARLTYQVGCHRDDSGLPTSIVATIVAFQTSSIMFSLSFYLIHIFTNLCFIRVITMK